VIAKAKIATLLKKTTNRLLIRVLCIHMNRYTLWLAVTSLLPGAIDCWVDNIRLEWNASTETYSNAPGVFTRTLCFTSAGVLTTFLSGSPGFGDTSSVESLDPDLKSQSTYMSKVVTALVAAGGVRNVSIRAAPYDFRYAPSSEVGDKYIKDLQALVEETYTLNGNKKVVVLSHSMGCLYSLYFFNQQQQVMHSLFKPPYV
jgi:lysophospholipase-3